MNNYLVIGGVLLVIWILITRPMSRQEAARNRRVRFTNSVISMQAASGVAVSGHLPFRGTALRR